MGMKFNNPGNGNRNCYMGMGGNGNQKPIPEHLYLTGNNAHQFEGQRSKVKVTRLTNAETGSVSYLPNGKAYEIQSWYTDGGRRPAI